ncbi:unnamed protein product [marine sediment metagenome]|uniref:Uncharacterized protein n=1 Tax=marine sediment metagenome TaxID=412755 RepID=X1FVU4_9ZZZZ
MNKLSMEELGKRIVEEAKPLYRKGMTKGEFAEKLFPGMDMKAAPPWAHWLLDFLWDLFFK